MALATHAAQYTAESAKQTFFLASHLVSHARSAFNAFREIPRTLFSAPAEKLWRENTKFLPPFEWFPLRLFMELRIHFQFRAKYPGKGIKTLQYLPPPLFFLSESLRIPSGVILSRIVWRIYSECLGNYRSVGGGPYRAISHFRPLRPKPAGAGKMEFGRVADRKTFFDERASVSRMRCITMYSRKGGRYEKYFHFFSWESEVLSLLHGAKMTRNCPIIIIALFFFSRKPLSST